MALDETKTLRSGNLLLLKYRAKPQKYVHVLTSVHTEQTSGVNVRGRHARQVQKPLAIQDYNQYMGGVDKVDLQPYDATRKTLKWYRKASLHLIQIALLNSWIIFVKSTNSTLTFLKFQINVITSLLFSNIDQGPVEQNETLIRLKARHFPEIIPPTEAREHPYRRCKVCRISKGIRKESKYYCPDCPSTPGLCIIPCLKIDHTHEDLTYVE